MTEEPSINTVNVKASNNTMEEGYYKGYPKG
jgi:hypothetical protein